MADILIDSYSESNQDANSQLFNGDVLEHGNSFTCVNKSKITTCKWYLKKYGSPTGNVTAKLYTHSGTYGTSSVPTGTVLAESSAYNIASLITSYQLITFTFPSYILKSATKYFISAAYSGGDDFNKLYVGYDSSSPTHSGNAAYYYLGTWYAQAAADLCFYVYGIPIGGGLGFGNPYIF